MRGSLLVGVLAGIVFCAAALVAFVNLLPDRPLGVAPFVPTASPTADASPSVPAASGSPSDSGGPPMDSPTPSGSVGVGLAVGDQAPPLVVPELGADTLDLARLRGRPIWVNFMATWCPPCRDELPLMARFQAQLGEDLVILVVDVKEDADTVASFMSSLGLERSLPVGLDEDGAAQQAWGAYALPVHYWLDGDGIVRAFAFGGPPPEEFIAGVHAVLPGAQLEP